MNRLIFRVFLVSLFLSFATILLFMAGCAATGSAATAGAAAGAYDMATRTGAAPAASAAPPI